MNLKHVSLLLMLCLCFYVFLPRYSSYNLDKMCQTLTVNAETTSKCCCAWYVMKALHSGGCYIGIYPAWFYKHVLPYYGFKKIESHQYIPQKGDIIVIENSEEHFWGHIAMYNGKQWISDFKQKSMNPYKKQYNYEIFRYKCGQ